MADGVSGKAPAHPKRCCIGPHTGEQEHTEQGAELVPQHSVQHHTGCADTPQHHSPRLISIPSFQGNLLQYSEASEINGIIQRIMHHRT